MAVVLLWLVLFVAMAAVAMNGLPGPHTYRATASPLEQRSGNKLVDVDGVAWQWFGEQLNVTLNVALAFDCCHVRSCGLHRLVDDMRAFKVYRK